MRILEFLHLHRLAEAITSDTEGTGRVRERCQPGVSPRSLLAALVLAAGVLASSCGGGGLEDVRSSAADNEGLPYQAIATINGSQGGQPVILNERSPAIVSAKGRTLTLAPFEQGDSRSVTKDFRDPIVAFQGASISADAYVAVQTCGDPPEPSDDQYQLCTASSSYELVVISDHTAEPRSSSTSFAAAGDLTEIAATNRWIAATVGQRIYLFDRQKLALARVVESPGLDACLAGDFIVSRDPSAAASASTSVVSSAGGPGRLLVERADTGEKASDLEFSLAPSTVVCGELGAVVVGGNGISSAIWTVGLDSIAESPRLVSKVDGSAVQALSSLGARQVSLITTFVDGESGASFVDPTRGEVGRTTVNSKRKYTDAERDQALAASYFWLPDNELVAIAPTRTGWTMGEVK